MHEELAEQSLTSVFVGKVGQPPENLPEDPGSHPRGETTEDPPDVPQRDVSRVSNTKEGLPKKTTELTKETSGTPE